MEILGIYDNKSELKCHGKEIFQTTSQFLDHFPSEYRTCYDRNIKDIDLFKVDEIIDDGTVATYVPDTNIIIFTKQYTLGHELFHVASEDRLHNRTALANKLGVEDGLVEGMTEYFHMKAYDLSEPTTYFFHVFCVMMLEDIPDIFKSYFIPTDDTFFTGITEKKHIYSLLYSIDTYNDYYDKYEASLFSNKPDKEYGDIVERSICDTIRHLITIELSICKNKPELNAYADKFIDLISSGKIAHDLKILYPTYMNYVHKEIKTRIRKKG